VRWTYIQGSSLSLLGSRFPYTISLKKAEQVTSFPCSKLQLSPSYVSTDCFTWASGWSIAVIFHFSCGLLHVMQIDICWTKALHEKHPAALPPSISKTKCLPRKTTRVFSCFWNFKWNMGTFSMPSSCCFLNLSPFVSNVTHFSTKFIRFGALPAPGAVSFRSSTDSVNISWIWHSEDHDSWYILIIKPTRSTNFANLFLQYDSTCFGQYHCLSSGF